MSGDGSEARVALRGFAPAVSCVRNKIPKRRKGHAFFGQPILRIQPERPTSTIVLLGHSGPDALERGSHRKGRLEGLQIRCMSQAEYCSARAQEGRINGACKVWPSAGAPWRGVSAPRNRRVVQFLGHHPSGQSYDSLETPAYSKKSSQTLHANPTTSDLSSKSICRRRIHHWFF